MSTSNRAELGDASVPFEFDVHAMIWSDDALALENALHREFHYRRVNLINERKEFFHVEIDEVAEVVRKLHGEIEITKLAEARRGRRGPRSRRRRADRARAAPRDPRRRATP
ncbi:GIY-YIG nuclease family protein [Sorangium sp. So ce131]|uniref:GIY-YIG nuclease family protein n=1 Tax=Sorangium sp. So ce131 TaxID=3133282 RepID=UPI003F5E939E